jgi:hypothetical protein
VTDELAPGPARLALAAANANADTIALPPVPACAATLTAQAMNTLAHLHSEVVLLTEDHREHLIDKADRAWQAQRAVPPEDRKRPGPNSAVGRILTGAVRRLRCEDDTMLVPLPVPTPMRVANGTLPARRPAGLPDFTAPPPGRVGPPTLADVTDPSGIAALYHRELGPPE